MKKQEVGGVPGNILGMMADLALKLQNGNITPEQFGRFLKKDNPFIASEDESILLTSWQSFYREVFGIEVDFTKLIIPPKQPGFNLLLILAQGMTPQRLYDKCKELFPSWKYTNDDLDKIIISDRTAKDQAYAIWVRDRVEADEELKNLSANDLKKQNIPGITLEERLVYELKFFKETGKHLDIQNWTLCTGSRDSDGLVPSAHWYDGKFKVGWSYPDFADDFLRSRQIVS